MRRAGALACPHAARGDWCTGCRPRAGAVRCRESRGQRADAAGIGRRAAGKGQEAEGGRQRPEGSRQRAVVAHGRVAKWQSGKVAHCRSAALTHERRDAGGGRSRTPAKMAQDREEGAGTAGAGERGRVPWPWLAGMPQGRGCAPEQGAGHGRGRGRGRARRRNRTGEPSGRLGADDGSAVQLRAASRTEPERCRHAKCGGRKRRVPGRTRNARPGTLRHPSSEKAGASG